MSDTTRTGGFVHLHVHTEYSGLDGMTRVTDAADKVAADGQPAIAITDHGDVGGAWAMNAAAKSAGIKPLIGVEAYLAVMTDWRDEPDRTQKQNVEVDRDDESAVDDDVDERGGSMKSAKKLKKYEHLTLFAYTEQGWRNLATILDIAEESGFHAKPRIDFKLLKEYHEGILVLTGCLGGPILGPISRHVTAKAKAEEAVGRIDAHGVPARRAAAMASLSESDRAAVIELRTKANSHREKLRALYVDTSEDRTAEYEAELALAEAADSEADRISGVDANAKVYTDPSLVVEFANWESKAEDALEQADRNMERIIDAVGKENVYLEIMEHGIAAESDALPAMVEFARKWDLPLVATNDSHYTNEEDHETHEAWLAVQSGRALSDPKRFQFHGRGYHIRTEQEMRALRPEAWWQEACDNTVKVAERFEDNVLPTPSLHLPQFPVPEGFKDSEEYLWSLALDGAKNRYGNPIPEEVLDRLKIEIGIISTAGFCDYFLIMHDLVQWARNDGNLPDWPHIERGILVGPGRGSAAGSVLSYTLEIVDLDPLEHNLLFERFMEEGRPDYPDIDSDFEQRYVNRVRAYLAHRWGHDKVARIGTHNVAQTKASIKDAARVLDLPAIGNRLSKAVPDFATFKDLDDPENQGTEKFRSELEATGDSGARIVDLARRIEGTLKGSGIHACGIIVSDVPLRGLIPLRRDRSKSTSGGLRTITAWDAPDIGDISGGGVGLLKLDILSIRNLDIVSQAVDFIEETTGERLDPRRLPHPDTKGDQKVQNTWSLLKAGRSSGLFQMDSAGMQNMSRSIGPDSWSDLSAILALFRPGPLGAGMDRLYADRKAGTMEIDYDQFTKDPAEQKVIDSVLGETYAVWVYQEQLMQLGAAMAGFDAKKRSKLRKAVGKKDIKVFEEVATMFIDGATTELRDEDGNVTKIAFERDTAQRVIDAMRASASYLFNKSHSAAYAQLAYVTAYLKANWPAEYGAAVLSTTSADDKRLAAMAALSSEGVQILPPDVNMSQRITSPEGAAVRLGLTEIKGVGQLGDDVVDARERSGVPFDSFGSLVYRISDVAEKKTPSIAAIEGLVEAGACDEFGPRLGQLMIARALKARPSMPVPDAEFGVLERSIRQRARLGVNLGEHPLASLTDQVREWCLPGAVEDRDEMRVRRRVGGARAIPISRIPDANGEMVLTAGLLAKWTEASYSRGRRANITLEGSATSIDGVLWDDALKAIKEVPPVGSVIAVIATVSMREREIRDEDDVLLEVVTTKEITVQRMYPIQVFDPPVGSFVEQSNASGVTDLPVPVMPLLKLVKPKATKKPPASAPRGGVVNHSLEPDSAPEPEPAAGSAFEYDALQAWEIPDDIPESIVEYDEAFIEASLEGVVDGDLAAAPAETPVQADPFELEYVTVEDDDDSEDEELDEDEIVYMALLGKVKPPKQEKQQILLPEGDDDGFFGGFVFGRPQVKKAPAAAAS
ncbi:DNA polymerase III subunit alpha [Agromyces sp. NPDC057679]|uniref:DNA polymerase III subunit alpha n=1 Tax=Agromyces sp. NPDC057679 TaxID=3346207 RepID=UPI0036703C04